jgi:competence protein ComEC
MPIIHFLNVNDGDCSVIEHASGRITVIDVCNAKTSNLIKEARSALDAAAETGISGNFKQRDYPVNPVTYMQNRGITSVFRFILTHSDMDHMDGLSVFFDAFKPVNFWDTDSDSEKDFGTRGGGYDEEDWDFYQSIKASSEGPKRLVLYSGSKGQYWNKNEKGESGGDGLQVLAPTPELVRQANESGDYNDCSYVILYRTSSDHTILFSGDSHDKTWDHILSKHEDLVKDVDVLIAPHHGRTSDRSFEFLDVVNPGLTLFGNANSAHLAYAPFNNRGLPKITNNQAGSVLVDADGETIHVYVSCEAFARRSNPQTAESSYYEGYYYWGPVKSRKKSG